MRFFIIVFGGIVAASAVNASPLALTLSPEAVAGSVLTNRGVTYEMSQLNEMKPFDQKVDDGHYPRPVTYQVHAGYTCTFYTESSRGCGTSIGDLSGPTSGRFDKWVTCYTCWTANTATVQISDARAADTLPRVETPGAIPCGWVGTPNGGNPSLDDTGKKFTKPKDIANNGEYFYPIKFHVARGCTCRFYTVHTDRGGPELIIESKGLSDGDFGKKVAARYACWTEA